MNPSVGDGQYPQQVSSLASTGMAHPPYNNEKSINFVVDGRQIVVVGKLQPDKAVINLYYRLDKPGNRLYG